MSTLTPEQLRQLADLAVRQFISRKGRSIGLTASDIVRAELHNLTDAGWYAARPNASKVSKQEVWWPDGAWLHLYWYTDRGELSQPYSWWVPQALTDLSGFVF